MAYLSSTLDLNGKYATHNTVRKAESFVGRNISK
jgi:hypothetical protein